MDQQNENPNPIQNPKKPQQKNVKSEISKVAFIVVGVIVVAVVAGFLVQSRLFKGDFGAPGDPIICHVNDDGSMLNIFYRNEDYTDHLPKEHIRRTGDIVHRNDYKDGCPVCHPYGTPTTYYSTDGITYDEHVDHAEKLTDKYGKCMVKASTDIQIESR